MRIEEYPGEALFEVQHRESPEEKDKAYVAAIGHVFMSVMKYANDPDVPVSSLMDSEVNLCRQNPFQFCTWRIIWACNPANHRFSRAQSVG